MTDLEKSAEKLTELWQNDYSRTIEDSLDGIIRGLLVITEHLVKKEREEDES